MTETLTEPKGYQELLAACEACNKYLLACTAAWQMAGSPEDGKVDDDAVIRSLGDEAAKLTVVAMDKVHGRLPNQMYGDEKVEEHLSLRMIVKVLLGAIKRASILLKNEEGEIPKFILEAIRIGEFASKE